MQIGHFCFYEYSGNSHNVSVVLFSSLDGDKTKLKKKKKKPWTRTVRYDDAYHVTTAKCPSFCGVLCCFAALQNPLFMAVFVMIWTLCSYTWHADADRISEWRTHKQTWRTMNATQNGVIPIRGSTPTSQDKMDVIWIWKVWHRAKKQSGPRHSLKHI